MKVFFFDESRFGTHSKIGHGWFEKGTRTPLAVKLGFQNFYLYGAVNPQSGDNYTLILPQVNTQCLNIFLVELSKQLGEDRAILVVDRAPWHKSKKLCIPSNIEIFYLPPYSPELNPVERLWQYIKRHTIKNTVYPSIKELEDRISYFVSDLHNSLITSLCSCPYLFN